MKFKFKDNNGHRWERICREACKQSGRFLFPKLEAFLSLEEALEQKPLQGKGWMLSNIENQNKGFTDIDSAYHVNRKGCWWDLREVGIKTK